MFCISDSGIAVLYGWWRGEIKHTDVFSCSELFYEGFDKIHFSWHGEDMLTSLVVNALAFYVVAYLVPGVTIAGWEALLVVAVVWGVLAILLKPILILLTLPINILTLGLFTFVINALLIMLMSRLVVGFKVEGFTTALLAAIVLALVNLILNRWK